MLRHVDGVFGSGLPPPPDSTDPMPYLATSSGVIELTSAWVICATFSSRVISRRRSRTVALACARWSTELFAAWPVISDQDSSMRW